MSQPIELDIAHQLGKAGARARLDGNIARIARRFPGAQPSSTDGRGIRCSSPLARWARISPVG